MEHWDLYDRSRTKTGKVVHRGEPFGRNEFHLVVHVCVINAANQLLIQQRQPFKEGWSNLWDLTIGGSALAGESSTQAAERELLEEIGLQADLSQIRPVFTVNFDRGFDDYYILKADPDLNQLTLQQTEVKEVKWASKAEITELIDKKEFIPYHPSLIELLFDMKDTYGAHAT